MLSLDEQYPWMQTPSILTDKDPFVSNFFRREFKNHNPQMYEWGWVEGVRTPIGSVRKDFKDQMLWHINQQYEVGTGRMVESCEKSYAVNFVELGNGYRLHCSGFNPIKMERSDNQIFLFDWLYQKKDWLGRKSNDGAMRLRSLINWMNQCSENPYNFVLFLPIGEDLLSRYAPHYRALGYNKTNHSTQELKKIYRFWLRGVETELQPQDSFFGNYWRAESYDPIDPIYLKKECSFSEVLKDRI